MGAEAYAVILAGGRGERFWPLSTSRRPKQFLSLVGEQSLLAQAVDRLKGVIAAERVYVITNVDLIEAAAAAAPELPCENIIGEPVGRDTAAAIALGAAIVRQRDPSAAFAVLTADHVIGDMDVFRRTLQDGFDLALREQVLLTIGIKPTEASTGYGYIESGVSHSTGPGGTGFLRARRFVEKPDVATAKSYMESGRHFWNSGMFIWSVKSITAALQRHRPQLYDLMTALGPAVGTPRLQAVLDQVYPGLDRISIDYAVMEKADNVVMAEGAFRWDDVGSWNALARHFAPDARGNIAIGSVEGINDSGNIVYSKERLTTLVGVSDLIVVQAEGVTLICRKDRAQDIKKLVAELRGSGRHDQVL